MLAGQDMEFEMRQCTAICTCRFKIHDIPGIRREESRLRQKRIAQVNESGASYLTWVPDILCMSPSPPNDGGS